MREFFIFLIGIIVLGSCNKVREAIDGTREYSGWQHLDLERDSVPGISLEKAHDRFVKEGEGEEVIVALIDSPVDIDHEDLKEQIYTNSDEIPDNGIDDDGNGHVDDLHGWNFLGHDGNRTIQFANYDHIRILRRLAPRFEGRDSLSITDSEQGDFLKYQRALEKQRENIPDMEGELAYQLEELKKYKEAQKMFSRAFDGEKGLFQSSVTDTLTPRNEREKELLSDVQDYAYYGWYPELMEFYVFQAQERKAKSGNPDYNEREFIGDSIYELSDVRGHGNVDAPEGWITHGTQVAGAIAATRNNGIGVRGVSNRIKLMPLVIFPERGDELDKDIANAIRYAVDNGAKVINYSHGKYLVDRKDFILEALRYARDHDVLVVTAAGNEAKNIDLPGNSPYPMDNPNDNGEIMGNLLKVGASGKNPDHIKPFWSSYGRENVDFFAPGQQVRTTNSGTHPYFSLGGSSLSCALTSGVAALVFSLHPDLSAKQVKNILLLSGTRFDQELEIDDGVYENFSELSRSGRVLNAYNALLLAKEAEPKMP